MTEFKVDLEAMAALVESLNSFEEKMKEYDVEDWVPNSGMLENPDVWDPTNAFQDTWEKASPIYEKTSEPPAALSAAHSARTRNTWRSRKSTWIRLNKQHTRWGRHLSSVRGHDLTWVLLHKAHQYLGSAEIPAAFPRAPR